MIKVKRILAVLLGFTLSMNVISIPVFAKSDVTEIYVATNGNDANDGSIERPLATIQAARDKVRVLKNEGKIAKNGAVINIREGSYNLSETVFLTAADSGEEGAPIVYRGYRDEVVELVGGSRIEANNLADANQDAKARLSDKSIAGKLKEIDLFKLGVTGLTKPYWKGEYSYYPVMLEAIKRQTGGDYVVPPRNSELFINGKAMMMSQYPNEGEPGLKITKVVEQGDVPRNYTKTDSTYIPPEARNGKGFKVQVEDDERLKNWSKAEEPLIYGRFFVDWADQTVPLAGIEGNVVKSEFPSMYGIVEDREIYITNLLEEIDKPGEFYINRSQGKLYIYPPDEAIDNMYISINNEGIFNMTNVSNVTIRNLKFTVGRGRAVYLEGGNNNLIDRCEMSYFAGDYTVYMLNTKNTGVVNSNIHDCDGGIFMTSDATMGELMGNYVENNELANNDRLTKTYKAGLSMQGAGNRASYNDIHGGAHLLVAYTGVENTLEFNDIYDSCKDMDDMGAVYTIGRGHSYGNKIMYNYVHDVGGDVRLSTFGVQGIYIDDNGGDQIIYGNVVEDIKFGSAIKGSGPNNVISNNVIVNCPTVDAAIDSAREFPVNDATQKERYDFFKTIPEGSRLWEDYNIKYRMDDASGKVIPERMTENQIIANNLIFNSTKKIGAALNIAPNVKNNYMTDEDPGFYNADAGIWLLKSDADINSKIEGFTPIPFTRIGRYDERALKRVENAIVFTNDEPLALVNGEVTPMNDTWTVNTFTENDTMYIPLRFAAENLGATVDYNGQTGGVTIVTGSKMINIAGDLSNVTIGGEVQAISAPIKRANGVTYIGFDDFATLFGTETYKGKINVLSSQKDIFSEQSDKEIINYLALLLTNA